MTCSQQNFSKYILVTKFSDLFILLSFTPIDFLRVLIGANTSFLFHLTDLALLREMPYKLLVSQNSMTTQLNYSIK